MPLMSFAGIRQQLPKYTAMVLHFLNIAVAVGLTIYQTLIPDKCVCIGNRLNLEVMAYRLVCSGPNNLRLSRRLTRTTPFDHRLR
jgi:hypothetical protein